MTDWAIAIEFGGRDWYATGAFAHDGGKVLPVRSDDEDDARRFGSEADALSWAVKERLLPESGVAQPAGPQWRVVWL